ncbi:MAG: hypothetical protein ABEJ25_07455 [Candidatus Bipolaricaulia bacterium]|nr:hypothetical protein [Candidatus Bipolaricaulota bacterium]
MKKFNRLISYLVLSFITVVVSFNSVFAHSEGEEWGHHMAGAHWGWGPMILFWIVGGLLVVLLTVTLLKTLQDS